MLIEDHRCLLLADGYTLLLLSEQLLDQEALLVQRACLLLLLRSHCSLTLLLLRLKTVEALDTELGRLHVLARGGRARLHKPLFGKLRIARPLLRLRLLLLLVFLGARRGSGQALLRVLRLLAGRHQLQSWRLIRSGILLIGR